MFQDIQDTKNRRPSAEDRGPSKRLRFPELGSKAYESPLDGSALESLKQIPLLPAVLCKFNDATMDRVLYLMNTSESVRCGPSQFPTLHALVREACSILDVPEPELYVRYNWAYNAYTAGVSRTFMVLQSALIQDFTDDELLFVVGHELGHIKCGHVLYQMLGRLLLPLLEALGQYTLGAGQLAGTGLVAGFFEWMRQAEFTCDRAGLLARQNIEAALSAIMKLGCGATRYEGEMSVETFLNQARAYTEHTNIQGLAKAWLFMTYSWQLDHPQIVFRAKSLDDWISNGAYDQILRGNYPRDSGAGSSAAVRCPGCGLSLASTVRYCPRCDHDLQAATSQGAPS